MPLEIVKLLQQKGVFRTGKPALINSEYGRQVTRVKAQRD